MKEYVEISPAEKLRLLQAHSMGEQWESLDNVKWCLHCESQFTGHSVRVYKDDMPGLWLECGNMGCNGSPIDWADHPWWDPTHPETQAEQAKLEKFLEEEAVKKPKKIKRR